MRLTQARPDGRGVIFASQGYGPLLQRDYDAVIEGADCDPDRIGSVVCERFEDFAPPETATFRRDERSWPLEVGDELAIRLTMLGDCRVRVVHRDSCSLTLRTLAGHPEAGRITFGGRRDQHGRPMVRIRSRTRANGLFNLTGFLIMGKQMQARCWINFIGNVAEACGGQVLDAVRVRTTTVEDEPADRPGGPEQPTFRCGIDEGK